MLAPLYSARVMQDIGKGYEYGRSCNQRARLLLAGYGTLYLMLVSIAHLLGAPGPKRAMLRSRHSC